MGAVLERHLRAGRDRRLAHAGQRRRDLLVRADEGYRLRPEARDDRAVRVVIGLKASAGSHKSTQTMSKSGASVQLSTRMGKPSSIETERLFVASHAQTKSDRVTSPMCSG